LSLHIIADVRLWAIQLEVLTGPTKTGLGCPQVQVIVEADDVAEARKLAKQRIRLENPGAPLGPDDVQVRATAEIGLENIWIFNDQGFRNIE
jgi:hypothetical protein